MSSNKMPAICEVCEHWQPQDDPDDLPVCMNEMSVAYQQEVPPDETCDEWEMDPVYEVIVDGDHGHGYGIDVGEPIE